MKTQWNGRHYETGSLCNALAFQGAEAPHSGRPYSEALLLGISGGIAFGYFTFAYEGLLPHVALLPRNTFNPFDTMLERLAIPQDVRQTADPSKGLVNLIEVLECGDAALVWADRFSLSYNALPNPAPMWAMQPLLVYGRDGDAFLVADGSSQPLQVSADELARARGRVKQDKHKLMTIDQPDESKLVSAVQKGIWQCINLFTEKPPAGGKDNFGFAAYQKLAKLLTNTRHKQSWERLFPSGAHMFHALAGDPAQPGAFHWIMTWGAADGAERGLYADFLDEAAQILKKPKLKGVAEQFRASHQAWCELANAMLPDDVPLLRETRQLLLRKNQLFIEKGQASLLERQKANKRLNELAAKAHEDFPLSAAEVAALRADLSARVLRIHDLELKAIETMQTVMA